MRILVFGGSGGLGTELQKHMLGTYISSKDCDITVRQEVEEVIGQYAPETVVNLAGTNYDTFLHKATDDEAIDRLIGVNVRGAINILSASLPHMREKGYGRIIMVTSVLAEKVQVGTGLYSATKCFVDSLMRTASAENIGKGVTCNSIRLGYFDGGMCHRIPEKFQEPIKNSIGLKRWGDLKELAQTIDYLINTEYITGQNINVSGGLL